MHRVNVRKHQSIRTYVPSSKLGFICSQLHWPSQPAPLVFAACSVGLCSQLHFTHLAPLNFAPTSVDFCIKFHCFLHQLPLNFVPSFIPYYPPLLQTPFYLYLYRGKMPWWNYGKRSVKSHIHSLPLGSYARIPSHFPTLLSGSVKALLFLPVSLYRPVFAPARPCANIIMCPPFPSSGQRIKNMSYNISHSQPVTTMFQKSSRKTG